MLANTANDETFNQTGFYTRKGMVRALTSRARLQMTCVHCIEQRLACTYQSVLRTARTRACWACSTSAGARVAVALAPAAVPHLTELSEAGGSA